MENNIVKEMCEDGREGVDGMLEEFGLKIVNFHGLPQV